MAQNNPSHAHSITALQALAKPSILDSIDPRAKVVMTLLFAFSVVLSEQMYALLFGAIVALTIAGIAKLALKTTLKRLIAMDMFMVVLLLILPFTVKGEVIYQLFGYPASWQGLEQGIKIALKANSVVLMIFSTVTTLPSSAVASTLVWLKIPDKLIQLMFFTLRYLSVIVEEFQRLRRSMKARSFVMGFNWHTWRSVGYLIGMMIVRAMQRSERIVKAMKCRGYIGRYHNYYAMQWQIRDTYYVLAAWVIVLSIIGLNFVKSISL